MCRRREKELGVSARGHVSHLWLVPRACALGPLGSRVGPPWPLEWALPSDIQAEGASEVVWVDFNYGILLWLSDSGLLVPRMPCVPSLKPSALCPHSNLVHCVCMCSGKTEG